MINIFANITAQGVNAAFIEAMKGVPQWWTNYCTMVPASAEVERLTWPGMLPQPREMISGRNFAGIRDFTYNVTNLEYELTFGIDRKSVEDDQTGGINMRIQEAAEVWAQFKNKQAADMFTNGATAGNVAFDGTVFFADTRVIGDSANIDNNQAENITSTNVLAPTPDEILTAVNTARTVMWQFQDDQARPYNETAMMKTRVLSPPVFDKPFNQAINASIIANTSNTYGQNLFEVDITPYLSSAVAVFYYAATGSVRKPLIYSERTALEVLVDTDPMVIAKQGYVACLCRQRYVFAYGDPRRAIKMTLT